jgi:hypothetical protein
MVSVFCQLHFHSLVIDNAENGESLLTNDIVVYTYWHLHHSANAIRPRRTRTTGANDELIRKFYRPTFERRREVIWK